MRATVDGNNRVLMINLRIYIKQAIVATSSLKNKLNDTDYLFFPYIVMHITQKKRKKEKEELSLILSKNIDDLIPVFLSFIYKSID
jgi:hypothetical protein